MDKEHTIKLNEDDWSTILAILEKEKDKTKDKEYACGIQEIITEIRCQVKYRFGDLINGK